jgi:hypothetical protein
MGFVMSLNRKLAVLLALTATLAACGKKHEEAVPAVAQRSAQTVAPVPAAAPAPASAAAPAAAEDPAAASAAAAKAAAVQAALAESEIASDSRGQWAVSATASSTYSGEKSADAKAPYTPNAATGEPDVERYGDDGHSWASQTADKGIEWLEVKFAKPVQATELRIRQSFGPGAIIKVEIIDEGGAKHVLWQGVDEQKYEPGRIAWWRNTFEKTSFKVTGARITLATNAVPGWNEIDAVQLLGD